MLQEIIKDKRIEIEKEDKIKKVRACPYYSPFKAICVNRRHPGFDEEINRSPRCNLRGKYSDCPIVDKVIELTLDENNSVIHREYLYIKGRINLDELEKDKEITQDIGPKNIKSYKEIEPPKRKEIEKKISNLVLPG